MFASYPPSGIPFGHTGHVRFLTCVDYSKYKRLTSTIASNPEPHDDPSGTPSKKKQNSGDRATSGPAAPRQPPTTDSGMPTLLIISGGDGYEDFRNSGTNPQSEVAGREDSTNHLLLWQI